MTGPQGMGALAGPRSVTVTIDQQAGYPDPTHQATVYYTVHFSEPVSGFGIGDVSLSGTAGATTVSVSGVGADYTVGVTGMTVDGGTVIATIPAGVAISSSGVFNSASTSSDNTVVWNDSYTDNFNRASLGSNWVKRTAAPNIDITGSTYLSGTVIGPPSGSPGIAFWKYPLGLDHSAKFTVAVGGAHSTFIRANGPGPEIVSCYELYFNTGTNWQWRKQIVGQSPVVIRNITSGAPGVGTIIEARAIGNTLSVWVDGTQIDSFTDTSLPIGQYVGARSDNTGNGLDNFVGKSFSGAIPSAVISGGTITTPGDGYEYHAFTSADNLIVSIEGYLESLMVGGGGGGGGRICGGGGGGGEGFLMPEVLTAGTYPITIGAGGTGGDISDSTAARGTNGGDTTFNGRTANGGGGGGGGQSTPQWNGLAGGNGGGGAYGSGGGAGGTGDQNNGGAASSGQKGGGGGGAGGGPGAASTSISGSGGAGRDLGSFGAGGGGSGGARTDDPNANIGSVSHGGALGGSGANGNNAVANRGGGGGGGGRSVTGPTNKPGGNGGSGLVVIRIRL